MNSEARHSDSVVIVDTIGHLRSFYALATLVFIGKSLTVKGGHNIIEPAFFSKPIIVGPYMQNFRDVLHTFKKGNALVQVQNAKELELAVSDLLDHPQKMVELGEKAKQIILSQQGATARGVELIVRALNKSI